MKNFGYLMITVGFLAGALVAVLDKEQVRWAFFSMAMIVGAAGIGTVHLGKRRKVKFKAKLSDDVRSIQTSLGRIVENVARLNAEKTSLNTYDVRHRIDELFPEDLDTFVEGRESIAHVHGLHAYADVMSYFAAAERYLNRVWSASADGYIDEVYTYLERAHTQFAQTLEKLKQLTEKPGQADKANP
ncbi:MAG: hypothetical protein ACYTEQ_12785 [Planctomycetota bacterium]|jgi:hypothetical protein